MKPPASDAARHAVLCDTCWRLDCMVNALPNPVFVKDKHHRWVLVNDALCELMGHCRTEVLGKSDYDYFPRSQADVFWEKDEHVLRTGEQNVNEELITDARGQVRTIITTKTLHVDEHGEPYIFAVIADVTERRRAEDALQQEQLLSRSILDSLPGIFYLYSYPENRLVLWNKLHESLLGFESAEIKGRHITEWHVAEARDAVVEAVEDVMHRGHSTMEALLVAKDGRRIPFFLTGARFEEQGKLYLLGVGLDITDRKRAEDALRSNESILRTFVNSHADMVYLKDAQLRHVLANPSLCRYFGLPEAEVLGKTDADLMPPAAAEHCRLGDEEALATRRLVVQEEAVGDARYETRKSPVQFADGTWGVAGTIRDVTERSRAEQEKTRLQDALQQAQKMESVGRLAGGVAHDFNNMLAVILGNVETALEHVDTDDPIHPILAEIRLAANRSADLTRQLLAFARKQTIAPKVLDLNGAVESTLNMLRRLVGEDVSLDWLPGAALWPVRMDPSQLTQVLANLCANARQAIPGVGRMSIETMNVSVDETAWGDDPAAAPGDYVRLAVSDTGCGMDPETLSHLFEPFFTTRSVGEGTGLGLATIYGIVSQNGGFITVDSERDHGTTFKIHLPRHRGEDRLAPSAGPPARALGGRETILLLEDEPAILRIAARIMERLGYTVLTAATPSEAIRIAREHGRGIDLLLSDVVMPEMNGRDLARILLTIHPRMKRLFMSGYTADVIAHHGVLEDGYHFLHKPFTTRELAAKLREVLDG